MHKRTISVDAQLDLKSTLRSVSVKAAGANSPIRVPGRFWAARSLHGPVTLRFDRIAETSIEVTAWGPGAHWGLDQAPKIIGNDDDLSSFRPTPGLVADLHKRNPGLRLGASGLVFEALLPIILGQRVTSVEAGRSYRSIVRSFGDPAPGPVDAYVAPSASSVATLSYADLHPHAVERSRASMIIEAARRSKRLEDIVTMSSEQAMDRLMAVRGIGPWTAALVVGVVMGAPDVVTVGDYHLPNTVSWALAGEPRGDDDRMLELLEPYRGHRRRVTTLIKQGGISAPKYGPKTATRSIAHI